MSDAIKQALNIYNGVDVGSAVDSASPVQLIIMLYDGAISALATAKGHMQEKRFAEKGRLISKAIGIIDGLRNVLDHAKGGDIARNLNDLYEYMKHRLAMANLKNDVEGPAEVIRLLSELRNAWSELEVRERKQSAVKLAGMAGKTEAHETLSLRA